MRKLYARYTDDKQVEVFVPPELAIWDKPPGDGGTLQPLAWKLDGWEGWLDTEGLRTAIIIDENAEPALQAAGATPSEIADLQTLIREGSAGRQPAVLEGLPTVLDEMPSDLVAVLRDQSVIVPQDGEVFAKIAEWANALSDTASADQPNPAA